jgi:hypothetical protein
MKIKDILYFLWLWKMHIIKIRPINDGGEFLRSQNQKRVDTNYYIFSASKNVVGPLSLGRMLRSDLFRGLVGVVNPSSVDTVDSPHFVEDVQEVIRNIKVPGYIDTVLMYYLEMDSEDVSEFFPEMDAAPFLTGAVALGLNKLLDIPEEMQILFEKLIGGMVDKTMDGVVPIASTYWSNRPSGPHFVKRKVVADHASIQKAEMTHAMIKHILLENELTTFQIGSPVNLYVYDKAGNIVGMKEGELQEKIPNAQFFIEGENVQTIIIEDNEEYNIVIESFDNGSFSFSSVQENDNQAIAIYYDEVNITDKSQAFFKMDDESSLLRIDYDGDGNIDYDVQPNDVEVNEFEQEEQDFTKSFDVNMPVRDDQKKGNLVVPIAVISLILIIVVLLIIKRKQNV